MRTPRILITILSLVISVYSYAGVIYVDKDMSDGFWQGSYTDLSDAIAAAQSGDEIWVASGTYTPGYSREDSFSLKEGVKIYGGFYGGEMNRSDRDVRRNATVLSGDIGITGDRSDNSYHVISHRGALTAAAVLDGFVIRDGNADNGTGGGGMLLENGASPRIANCRFVNNTTTAGGGAIHLSNGPLIEACLFESNSAAYGGAICSPEDRTQNGDASISRSTFVLNTALSGSALFIDKRETVRIDSSIFWLNMNGSGTVNTFSLNTTGGSASSVDRSATDDSRIYASSVSNIIYYTSSEADGPFVNTADYRIDNNHGIPRDYGWYYTPTPLVLNIKIFLEGAF